MFDPNDPVDLLRRDEDSDAVEYSRSMSKHQSARIKDLQSARQAAADPFPTSAREHWLKRNASWAMPIIVLLIGGGGWTLNLYVDSRVRDRLQPLTEKITQLQTDLSEIKGELKRISARAVVEDAASAPLARLATQLVNVRTAMKDARALQQSLPERSILEIQGKLLKVDNNARGYWPLVFDLIGYRSIVITGLTSPPSGKVHEMSDVSMSGGDDRVGGGYVRLSGNIEGVRFVGTWVEFDASKPVVLKNVHFDHCVLVFVGFDPQTPDPSIQHLAREILAADLTKFTIAG